MSKVPTLDYPVLVPDLQISFYHRLKQVEGCLLGEALRSAVERTEIHIGLTQLRSECRVDERDRHAQHVG